ncbi:MFS transporter [Lentilactobacillus buchneri]|uniref:MFS transporter n=1 Tax=Lentilactobacillus buchneri TaxID=1581 RepID=UPI0002075EAF|nr:sugar transporter [Lentilactobacillus buchneri NRRL B-30929]
MEKAVATEKKISSGFIYFFGSFGGILFGYDIGVMTGALPFLQTDWGLQNNATITGWITSAVMLGAIFGGAIAGQLSDKMGRRKMILLSALIFMAGSLLSAISPHDGQFYLIAVRVFLGLAVGASSALVPAYMSEMAPAKMRGRLTGINQTMIVSGMLLSYVMDFVLKDLPESPRFLVKNGRPDDARRVLSYIRENDTEIDDELEQIQDTASQEKKISKSTSWATVFSSKYRYLAIAGIGVAAFQQFQGANAIFYYIPLIVEKATGTAANSALMWPIIQGIILVIGSLVFLGIADKFKRRTLLILGGTVMGLSFLLPTAIKFLVPNASPLLIVFFLSIYVAAYSFTWAPLTWVLIGEVFPLAIRGRASGAASSANWVGSFAVGLLFPIMTASMPQDAVFAIFGVICLLGVWFIHSRVPETKGRSLEDIEEENINK